MAKYEVTGYNPSRGFYNYPIVRRNELYYEIMNRLASRHAFMFYSTNEVAFYGYSYIVDAMCGGTDGRLGMQITNQLLKLIPDCRYPDYGRTILVRDVLNPFLMGEGDSIRVCDNTFNLLYRRSNKDHVLFQDERYVVLIREDPLKRAVMIDLFKKEPCVQY